MREGLEDGEYLSRQFSGRCENDGARSAGTAETGERFRGCGGVGDGEGDEFLGAEGLYDGEEVGEGFSGS